MIPPMGTGSNAEPASSNGTKPAPAANAAPKWYSLSVSAENRDRLEKLRLKKEFETRLGVSWDKFFTLVIDDLEKVVLGPEKKRVK